jgi:hypothetical protein
MRLGTKITKGCDIPHPSVKSNVLSVGEHSPQRYDFIPIDFLKCQLIDVDINRLLSNPKLHFIMKVCNTTGVIKRHTASYYNIKIEVCPSGYAIIKGSLHALYNNGKHNHNDFDVSKFESVLNQLKIDLGILPENLNILQMEWGFNFTPPVETNEILNHLHQHKKVMPTNKIDCNTDGKYLQFKHSTYILKLYNKALHYGLNTNLMRAEIKQTNWSGYRKKGIVTLHDFIKVDKTMFLYELLNQWQKVVYCSPHLNANKNFSKYDNANFWRVLRADKSNTTFSKHFHRLQKLNQHNGVNIQYQISEIIKAKAIELNGGVNVFQLNVA